MKPPKKILLVTLTLLLVGAIGTATILGPSHPLPEIVPANAITCPTGGTTNGCLTVSLDPVSIATTVATTTCAIPVGQLGVCDTSISNAQLSNRNSARDRKSTRLNSSH